MTDPQDDVPCRDCGALTQHDTERCDDCRTPAGRLVTALAAMGIKAEALDYGLLRAAGLVEVTIDDGVWSICDLTGDMDAETAIAAIVRAPGLRAENETLTNELGHYMAESHQRTEERDTLAAEVKRLREELEKPVAGAWQWNSGPTTESRFGNDGRKIATVYEGGAHWCDHMNDKAIREGGKHAADLALLAAGYRLVGGVHPLPSEVPDAR